MPGDTEGMFYSYNLGQAHIISISTEAFYYPQYGNDSIKTQYNWLKADLQVRKKEIHSKLSQSSKFADILIVL